VAFRSQNNTESPVSITYIGYNELLKTHQRLWNAPTGATMPATVSLYTMDLLGDRSVCIIITGMNAKGEHTMTVYRKNPLEDRSRVFEKIADIRMDGSVAVQDTERPLAYRQGISNGQPFSIIAYGHDGASQNMLDRLEIVYSFNRSKGIYEPGNITRVPGSQIEQRRVREILTGEPKVFENFINDLWYHISPQGTVDKNQYLYFDPAKREVIFFGDGTQQIFTWQYSHSTRYGLYVSSQSISVTTLRRFLNIELESLDNIRIRVSEDVRLKIDVNTSWDGLYRRAGSAIRGSSSGNTVHSFTEAVYDTLSGRITFLPNGEYEFSAGGKTTKGRYIFFRAGGSDLLELRPEQNSPAPFGRQDSRGENGGNRLVYHITAAGGSNTESRPNQSGLPAGNINISRVRLGVAGIQFLHEEQIALTRVTVR
jgi:hypothetical protein